MSDSSETPWAKVQRMRGEGAGLEAIVAELRRELPIEDIETLFQGDADFAAWKRGQPKDEPPRVAAPERAGPPIEWGRIGRWTVITLSAIASGIAGAIIPGVSGAIAMLAAALPAIALIILEARRERARTLRATGYVLFFGYFIPALANLIGEVNLPRVIGAVLLLISVPMIILVSMKAPRLSGLVDLGMQHVFERDGVHFAVLHDGKPVGVGGYVTVQVFVQNILDVPRTLTVSVRGDGSVGVEKQQHSVVAEPGVIQRVSVPVRVPSLAQKAVQFIVDFDVTGDGIGRRLTLHRGADWVTPSSATLTNVIGAMSLLAGGVGVFRMGSNGVISVSIDENQQYSTELNSLATEEVYRPTQQELEKVLRG